MEKLLEFFLKAGEVKRLKQRGLVLRRIKDPATIGGHSFREALMGWIFTRTGKIGLDSGRVIKLVLVRDLCAGYAGDPTPYDHLLKKAKGKNHRQIFTRWVRTSKIEKERAHRQQWSLFRKSMKQLTRYLPVAMKTEVAALFVELEQGLTREGRFVQQLHMVENFLQSIEYWREDKTFPIESWWQQIKELLSDPTLIALLAQIDKKFARELRKI